MATANLTEGPIGPALRSLAVPMGFGIVFLMLVNLVDTVYVGRLGVAPLAAMSFTFPVITAVMAIAMGLGVGSTSAIARAIGHGDRRVVRRLATHAMALAMLVVAVVSIAGIATQDAVFTALGASDELLPLLRSYMTLWFAGVVFLIVPIVGNGALRAAGDAKTPMKMMMVAAVANFILDPLFIYGWGPFPRLELAGAALATLIARALIFVYAIHVMRREDMLDIHLPSVAELLGSWKTILSVGGPAALSNLLGPVAAALLTAMIAAQGDAAIAAYGIGSRIESLLMIVPFALTAALSPFIGQNWGAHKNQRVSDAVRISLRISIAWCLGGLVILWFVGGPMSRVFTPDADVEAALRVYFRVLPVGYVAIAVVNVVNSTFNAVDRAVRATLVQAARSLLLAIPLAWLGGQWLGLEGIYGGVVLAAFGASLLALRWLPKVLDVDDHLHAEARDDGPVSLDAFQGEVRARVQRLVDDLSPLEGVRVHPTRGNAVGFFMGTRELGHVHPAGHLDLALPVDVADRLIGDGVAEHHRHHHDCGWITHRLQDDPDHAESERLLTMARDLFLAA